MRTLRSNNDNNVETVVFDIDGVLADNSRRLDRIDHTNPDWTDFHLDQHEDPVIEANMKLLRLLWAGGYNIVLMTNRFEAYRTQTEMWLTKHEVPHNRLIMRQHGTRYEGAKAKYVERLRASGADVVLYVDDDPDHCRNVEEVCGVPALYVHSGYKERFNKIHAFGSIPDDPVGVA